MQSFLKFKNFLALCSPYGGRWKVRMAPGLRPTSSHQRRFVVDLIQVSQRSYCLVWCSQLGLPSSQILRFLCRISSKFLWPDPMLKSGNLMWPTIHHKNRPTLLLKNFQNQILNKRNSLQRMFFLVLFQTAIAILTMAQFQSFTKLFECKRSVRNHFLFRCFLSFRINLHFKSISGLNGPRVLRPTRRNCRTFLPSWFHKLTALGFGSPNQAE